MLLNMDRELLQIIGVTLRMSFFSTLISCLVGMPMGVIMAKSSFRGKRTVRKITGTFMGLPPVVAGLIVYLLFTRYGPFGSLGLLFTVEIMVVAQCMLIIPVVINLTESILSVNVKSLTETAKGLSFSKWKTSLLLLTENRFSLISVVLTAFGRSIAEVGAVSLVGGNIQWKTRVMTTAIMLETNKGNFTFALALGIVLLLISLAVNILASFLTREDRV
ncbi:MAG: ABC transporter permease subunit [Ruminococcaceae bacterium]|nr:ABC transporter permease subunit [Oscillospiraceae bacterium]MBQ9912729.1 ABC transporter permease [Clostridia bacterium]